MHKPRARRSSTYLTRRRWTAEEARQVLVTWEESGLELTAFAIGEGLDPQRLTRWRRRLAVTHAPTFEEVAPCVAMATLPGNASASSTGERFEIVLVSGRVVRVPESFDASALQRLLAVVDEGRAC
jgi:hypothetical protein